MNKDSPQRAHHDTRYLRSVEGGWSAQCEPHGYLGKTRASQDEALSDMKRHERRKSHE